MKLELNRRWYERRLPQEGDLDVTVRTPDVEDCNDEPTSRTQHPEDLFVERHAFGALVQMLRRDRRLSIAQLAVEAQIEAAEIVAIERDPEYVPRPRTVHQLASFFGLSNRALLKLSNVTAVDNTTLRDAAVRFAAHSTKVIELSSDERQALSEFVKFLSSQDVK